MIDAKKDYNIPEKSIYYTENLDKLLGYRKYLKIKDKFEYF